jgi:hypothetical protein
MNQRKIVSGGGGIPILQNWFQKNKKPTRIPEPLDKKVKRRKAWVMMEPSAARRRPLPPPLCLAHKALHVLGRIEHEILLQRRRPRLRPRPRALAHHSLLTRHAAPPTGAMRPRARQRRRLCDVFCRPSGMLDRELVRLRLRLVKPLDAAPPAIFVLRV